MAIQKKQEMLELLENEYISKIFGFCVLKMNSKEDAEDLSQEITLEILKAIHSNKAIENFNAFVWSVANHIFFKWLRIKRKKNNTVYLTELFSSEDDIETEYIQKEEKYRLCEEISLLSKNYRETVIYHYFEGKSCEEIANLLNKSIGTVKWWLHDARKFIKEGIIKMREYGEKSYKPGTLFLSCQGNPGLNDEPITCTKRKSTQNILLAAYRSPMSVEELCLELGISAPYIEDEIQFLTDNQLMKEVSKDKFCTDFVILTNQELAVSTMKEIYNTAFPNYYNELIELLENNKNLLSNKTFNTAKFSWERLLWVYIHMITDINLCKFKSEQCKVVKYNDIPIRPNGGRWIAIGYNNDIYSNPNKALEVEPYMVYDGPVHKTAIESVQGFFHKWSGVNSSIFFDIPNGVFELCREIIDGNIAISCLDENQKYLFSIAVEKKLFIKTEEKFEQNYFYIRETELKQIQQTALNFYDKSSKYFKLAYDIVTKNYVNDIPKRLHWQMGNLLSNYLNIFVTCSLYEAINNNLLSKPNENNSAWLSLFASN